MVPITTLCDCSTLDFLVCNQSFVYLRLLATSFNFACFKWEVCACFQLSQMLMHSPSLLVPGKCFSSTLSIFSHPQVTCLRAFFPRWMESFYSLRLDICLMQHLLLCKELWLQSSFFLCQASLFYESTSISNYYN